MTGPWNENPYIYEVEPTNSCPYGCIMCPRGRGVMKRPVGFMSVDVFRIVLEQVPPDQRMLRLHHFGEAVLHPKIYSFIRLTAQQGLIPALSLNPSTLDDGMTDRLIESGVGIVCFSLDSLRTERMTAIRGIRKTVEYCLERIDYFISKSRRSTEPVLKIVQMVALAANEDEREEFLALKKRYPEDDVYVYISGNYGFGDMALVRETAGAEEEALRSGGAPCVAPFTDVVVLWNGDVVLCCYDYDGFNVIGNVGEQSLKEIWNGGKAEEIRKLFRKRESGRLEFCGRCYLAPHNFDGSAVAPRQKGLDEERYILNLFPPFMEATNGQA